jgi:5-bromo-4-chloroindolyl phosphate hydrolysis protein
MKEMEHNYAGQGHVSLGVSIIMGILARIDVGEFLKNGSVVISIIAGIMAIRYYYYATKKQK